MSERDKIPNTGDPLDVMKWAMTFGDWVKATLDGLHTSRVAALADELTALREQLAEAEMKLSLSRTACLEKMSQRNAERNRAEHAEADNARLRVDSDMLHYTFHSSGEDWFPKRYTYGMWCRDVCRLMIQKGYWTRGVPEYAQALADTEGSK